MVDGDAPPSVWEAAPPSQHLRVAAGWDMLEFTRDEAAKQLRQVLLQIANDVDAMEALLGEAIAALRDARRGLLNGMEMWGDCQNARQSADRIGALLARIEGKGAGNG